MKALIFARTSKKTQNTDRQVSDLTAYAYKEGFEIVKVIDEQISGSAKIEKRKGVIQLLEYVKTNKVDIVLATEVSRLGRSPSETFKIVEELTNLEIPIFFQSYHILTLLKDDKGVYKRNPLAMLMYHILSEMAYMEKVVLIERIKSGQDEAKRKGKALGRRTGTTTSNEDLLKRYSKLVADLKSGLSLQKCMKVHSVSKNTVIKIKRMIPVPIN